MPGWTPWLPAVLASSCAACTSGFLVVVPMEACLMKWAVPMPWQAGVTFIEGRGKLIDAHTVDVDGKRYTVRTFRQDGTGRKEVDRALRKRSGSSVAVVGDGAVRSPQCCAEPAVCGAAWCKLTTRRWCCQAFRGDSADSTNSTASGSDT